MSYQIDIWEGSDHSEWKDRYVSSDWKKLTKVLQEETSKGNLCTILKVT